MNDKDKIQRLLEIVKELEWTDYDTFCNEVDYNDLCHFCGNRQTEGHKENCKLGLLLKEIDSKS
jgi:hypothetical protein